MTVLILYIDLFLLYVMFYHDMMFYLVVQKLLNGMLLCTHSLRCQRINLLFTTYQNSNSNKKIQN